MASLIVKKIEDYTPEEMKVGLHVLFSAHGVPESYIEAGDPYQRHIEECVRLISSEVSEILTNDETRPAGISKEHALALTGKSEGNHNGVVSTQFHLSFQSRVGPVQWLKPYTEETLEELGESGVKNLIVVPVSFVSEHIETLEEIDMEYRELAEKSGVTHWSRVPALNTDERFISDMADMVMEALESPVLSVSEAASQNAEFLVEKSAISSQLGLTMQAEMLNGRLAMMGIVGTTVFEVMSGHPVVQMVGLR
jgi:ferrochelatase